MLGKVIDVTFHGGREQSAILDEIEEEVTSVRGSRENVEDTLIPEVVTNETIREFCLNVIKETPKSNQMKRRVYAGIIKLIDDYAEIKAENLKLKVEDLKKQEIEDEVIKELENDESDSKERGNTSV